MGKSNFTEDFRPDAVLQLTERGDPAAEADARPGSARTRPTSGRSDALALLLRAARHLLHTCEAAGILLSRRVEKCTWNDDYLVRAIAHMR